MTVQGLPEVQAARDPGERVPQRIVEQNVERGIPQERLLDRIPEQIAEHGIPQGRIAERIPEQIVGRGIPQKRTSERIPKQIVGRGIPQERISERSVGQIVGRGIPQERISERIVEQNVDESVQAIPQERIPERNAGQIVDVVPGLARTGTSISSAAAPGDAECPKHWVFRTFLRKKKVRHPGPSRVRHWSRTRAHGRRRPMTLLMTTGGPKSGFGVPGGSTRGTGSMVSSSSWTSSGARRDRFTAYFYLQMALSVVNSEFCKRCLETRWRGSARKWTGFLPTYTYGQSVWRAG